MMSKGRKRKAGVKRTQAGRISRAAVNFDKGTERAQAMQVLYGQDGADAIGRAYRAGLLGDGSEAKAMLDTARRISNAYWSCFAVGKVGCAIGDKAWGAGGDTANRVRKREEWLNEMLLLAKRTGNRTQFDALVIDIHPDHGPTFLDEVIYAKRRNCRSDRSHETALIRALETLSELAGVPCHIPDFEVEKTDRKRAA